MKVEFRSISVRDLVSKYQDDGEGGVVGYGGKLDIRPAFQREFVYTDRQREAVIRTINQGFPLNVMYWADNGGGHYEVIDGQQRTISVAQYVSGDYSVDGLYFHNLPRDKADRILEYELMIYVCTGTDSEKLDWFRTVNIAGEKLTNQELRNAVYSGTWVSDAKRYFSKVGGAAYQIGKDHLKGTAIRQDYLQTAIDWISGGNIEDYMGRHQHDADATALWEHFQAIIAWVKSCFKTRPKLMKGVDWGSLYREFHSQPVEPDALEQETLRLIDDDDVTRQSGIYAYLFTRNERHLSIRVFSKRMKRRVYERQEGRCVACGEEFKLSQMEADHITPWAEGGRTIDENCQMLCKDDNRRKGVK